MIRVGRSAVRTDPGRKRRGNEDAYVVKPPLFAIADGMGGAQAGEVASALAADALRDLPEGAGAGRVIALIQEANRRVHDRASTDASTSGMGTTITAAIVEDDGTITFGHVGDSRAYLLRDDRLEQITNDHSLVAELVRRGELSPAEAEVHPQRSVITRALGTDPDIDVDTFAVEPQPDDLYLICSDGLSDMVDGGDIEVILRTHRNNLDEAARALIQAANRAGGEDNITAVLFETVGENEPDETTREYQDAPKIDDTLHPEDHVAPPAPAPAADDTMVVRVEQLTAEEEAEEEFEAGLGRRMLALAVIIALCVLIVVLVWWGLAR
ncbi:MAG TPA: Stp1/IreP family PP2C-type Ser/Thr phosphatase [Gaiellaceae bacterium]|nr:Stp1/IreP family PP2C-type Ser/Thr phosphatase [Gaiellaceae bacterium]